MSVEARTGNSGGENETGEGAHVEAGGMASNLSGGAARVNQNVMERAQ